MNLFMQKLIGSKKANANKVRFYHLLSYFIKLILIDKAFIILTTIFIIASIIFAVVGNFNDTVIIIFNWYFLANVVLMFILNTRLITYFFHNKFADQTMTIIIQQKTARFFVLISIWLSIFIVLAALQSLTSGLMIAINFANYAAVKYLIVNLVFQIVSIAFLIAFFSFITLLLKQQIISIILSFILLSIFLSSLPQQLFNSKMESTIITLKKEGGNDVRYKASDIYHAFTFNEHVKDGHIKFPHLSKYINDFYVTNKFIKNEFENSDVIEPRFKMWNDLGIINLEAQPMLGNDGSNIIPLKILTVNDRSGAVGFERDDVVNVKLTFKNTFKSIAEIKEVYQNAPDETKLILGDFIDFYEYYQNYINSLYGQSLGQEALIQKFWQMNYREFGRYLSLQIEENSEIIKSVPTKENQPVVKKIDKQFFENYFFKNFYVDNEVKNRDLLFYADIESEPQYAKNYQDLIHALEKQMNIELFARILEENFINQTSDYVVITNASIVKDENYNNYISYINNNNLVNTFLFPAGINSIFEQRAGKEWNKYWFNLNTTSKIDFSTQDNLFFTKAKFRFAENPETNKVTEMIKPDMNVYIYIQVAFFVIEIVSAMYVFIRRDLK
ncbi:hypothetical protein [Williamsoniiplasma lucivorax]|uniref:Uncharacterized protein n=1 Tax=Williamsoniiplasma lucivorax TaxID=209274 RepID=A0A2S5RFJ2_9MOLU|nr:hypothetical protein [Williamsoniiplasma lucivorax]PPE06106.1 hypothetical protein ELUCI_v1c03970 [Williamsoniiplasma lucivorax]